MDFSGNSNASGDSSRRNEPVGKVILDDLLPELDECCVCEDREDKSVSRDDEAPDTRELEDPLDLRDERDAGE